MQKYAILIAAITLSPGCVRQNDNLDAVLWMQTAAEYRGNSLSIYHAATDRLPWVYAQNDVTAAIEQAQIYDCQAGVACKALAQEKNLLPAIVLDVDETVLDNSVYQARLVRDNGSWNPATWAQWLSSQDAAAIPGAVDFIKAAKKQGMAIVYITNRACTEPEGPANACPQKADTVGNLKKAGFPDLGKHDLMILKNERAEWNQSDKKLRREYVSKKYRIAMLIGDDLGDLAPGVKTIGIKARFDYVDQHAALYGNYWFQLSNPTYGSWMNPFKGKDKFDFLVVEPGGGE